MFVRNYWLDNNCAQASNCTSEPEGRVYHSEEQNGSLFGGLSVA
jgi:hypothetical protein